MFSPKKVVGASLCDSTYGPELPVERCPDPHSIEQAALQERLRQAQQSFNLAILALATSSVIGVGILCSGQHHPGIIAAIGSATAGCVRFAKKANDRLDQLLAGKS
jgi:hypothetical protein